MEQIPVYFHLRKSKSGNILVISIAHSKDGPYYLFNKLDRKPERHQLLAGHILALEPNSIAKLKNLKVILKSSTLKQYFDQETQRFRFRNLFLPSVKELDCEYSGNSFNK